MDEPQVFMVEWGSILVELQKAIPDFPTKLAESSWKSFIEPAEYALSSPRTVAIVAAQRFASDFNLPKGKNSTVLPVDVRDQFWSFVAKAIADAVLVWDRETNNEVYAWASRKLI
jgi:hypothetical protein